MTQQILTFAVLDLETTSVDPESDRITEIAILAVSRQDFLTCVQNKCAVPPRILSKIVLPVNPGIESPIHPKAAEKSGKFPTN